MITHDAPTALRRPHTVLLLMVATLACSGGDGERLTQADRVALESYCGEDYEEVEERITRALRELTLEEKASLMHGDAVLPRGGDWSTGRVERLAIHGFDMLDGPRGLSQFSGVTGTAFPVAMARGATWSPELEQRVGEVVGAELRVVGANVLLAPTVNVLRHPLWGRAQETYGEDPMHIGALGTAFVLGAQRHVMTVVKHFALNSIENTRLEVNVNVDERTLREIYLPHFERIVREGHVAGVMTSYNQVNGAWGSENVHLVREILRGDWDFRGFTVSDFSWGTHDTERALTAGLDVEMQFPQYYGAPVVAAVQEGRIDEAVVDAAIRRILRGQFCFEASTEDSTITARESPEALALAAEVATRSMVLLENRGGVLPIDRSAAPTIAVVGPLADATNTGDRGSSHVNSSSVTTALAGLRDAAGAATVVHVPGDLSAPADRDTVMAADIVVAVVGYTELEEGEAQLSAGDRVSMALPSDDLAILEEATSLHPRVVAVVVGGSAFTMEGWQNEVEGIVVSWYSGARGGDALAALLYGDANFSGRLPITFASDASHLPEFDNVSLEVDYGYFHGYRLLQHDAVTPLYPFGFGRSYTTFSLSNGTVAVEGEKLVATVDVSNTGAVDGRETVQVYVGAPDSLGPRAPRDLRGFAQVEVASGESGTARIEIPLDSLRVWDTGAAAWALPEGPYVVELGTDVETLPIRVVVDL